MVIVDTSIVFKWFDQSEVSNDIAMRVLDAHIFKKNLIIAPSLILYELTNAWATKSAMDVQKINANLTRLEKYNIELVHPDMNLMKKIGTFSKEYKVSAYDATYAVLAKEKKCNLITADEKFADKVRLPYIKKLKDIA